MTLLSAGLCNALEDNITRFLRRARASASGRAEGGGGEKARPLGGTSSLDVDSHVRGLSICSLRPWTESPSAEVRSFDKKLRIAPDRGSIDRSR